MFKRWIACGSVLMLLVSHAAAENVVELLPPSDPSPIIEVEAQESALANAEEGYEMQLRLALHDALGMPLTAELTWAALLSPAETDADPRSRYAGTFQAADGSGKEWQGEIGVNTGLLTNGKAYLNANWSQKGVVSDIRLDPFDDRWEEKAVQVVTALRPDGGALIDRAEAVSETSSGSLSAALVRVWMQDGSCYHVTIIYTLDDVGMIEFFDKDAVVYEDHFILTMLREG